MPPARIDHGAGERASRCHIEDGPAISRAALQQVACDAVLSWISHDARGNALDAGRRRREPTPRSAARCATATSAAAGSRLRPPRQPRRTTSAGGCMAGHPAGQPDLAVQVPSPADPPARLQHRHRRPRHVHVLPARRPAHPGQPAAARTRRAAGRPARCGDHPRHDRAAVVRRAAGPGLRHRRPVRQPASPPSRPPWPPERLSRLRAAASAVRAGRDRPGSRPARRQRRSAARRRSS